MNIKNVKNSFTQKLTVNTLHTAEHLGSGLLPVLATPALVALMENTAMQLIESAEGKTSVGISIQLNHVKASGIDEIIACTANLIESDGKKFKFELTASNEKDEVIGSGTHERVLIDINKFMSKIK